MILLKMRAALTAAIWFGGRYFPAIATGNGTAKTAIPEWFLVLIVPPMLIYAGASLRTKGRARVTNAVVCLAVPVALFRLLMARLMSWNGRWNWILERRDAGWPRAPNARQYLVCPVGLEPTTP